MNTKDALVNPLVKEGWYIRTDGRVEGPFDSETVRTRISGGPKDLVVSHRGFSQWYRPEVLSSLLDRNITWQKEVQVDFEDFNSDFLKHMARLGKVKEEVEKQVVAERTAKVADPVGAEASNLPISLKEDTSAEKEVLTSEREVVETRPTPLACKIEFKPRLPRDYYLVQGRMRMGRLRSPSRVSIGMIFTFGISFPFWANAVRKELEWHLGHDVFLKNRPWGLLFLPIVHVVGCYLLAKKVVEVESQNGYAATNPLVATGVALFPPFYIWYLQKRVNSHWLRHARHSLESFF